MAPPSVALPSVAPLSIVAPPAADPSAMPAPAVQPAPAALPGPATPARPDPEREAARAAAAAARPAPVPQRAPAPAVPHSEQDVTPSAAAPDATTPSHLVAAFLDGAGLPADSFAARAPRGSVPRARPTGARRRRGRARDHEHPRPGEERVPRGPDGAAAVRQQPGEVRPRHAALPRCHGGRGAAGLPARAGGDAAEYGRHQAARARTGGGTQQRVRRHGHPARPRDDQPAAPARMPAWPTSFPTRATQKCWAIYTETYAKLQESGAANTGGSLLAPLAEAYARQLRRGR